MVVLLMLLKCFTDFTADIMFVSKLRYINNL